ncbi:excalibur calcium-binding domain-containing protein [Streptomyces sp. SBC-4]|nr:excalibur calcium-binding domain-containing protein [Streptomyces sp. SBC-4]MDV5147537.1 excalibur calcium-binding domain-containing protein [Streptomyces sp. SBC-4]
MHTPPHPYQPAPMPAPRRWWQHPALIICLLVILPPAGIALVWTSRWGRTQKIAATVLSALWFLLFALSDPPKDTGGTDPKAPASTTAPASPSPTPTTEATTGPTTTVTPTPEPTTTVTPTPEPTSATPEPTTEPTTTEPTTAAPEPTRTPTRTPTLPPTRTPAASPSNRQPETAEPSEPAEESSVYYANCSAVRAAGAAPIRIGDPGYARHLDRDGDGVACEG